jgi:hypothetical protein
MTVTTTLSFSGARVDFLALEKCLGVPPTSAALAGTPTLRGGTTVKETYWSYRFARKPCSDKREKDGTYKVCDIMIEINNILDWITPHLPSLWQIMENQCTGYICFHVLLKKRTPMFALEPETMRRMAESRFIFDFPIEISSHHVLLD